MKNTQKTKEIGRLEKTIAELRQTIDTLKQSSAAQLKQIGENLPEGGFYQLMHTPDGRRYCSYASERFGRLFQTDNDLIKKDVNALYNLFLPEDVERVVRLEQESLERMDRFDLEAPMRLPDGQIRWFQWHSKPNRLNDGTCIWDGVCLDITRRKKAEDELRRMRDELENQVQERTADLSETLARLREAELRYRTVANYTYDWEYWTNLDGSLNYVSPSCQRISGYAPHQFIDTPSLFKEIILTEDQHIWEDHYHDARAEQKAREIQFRIRHKNGSIRWIEHVCHPIIDHDRGLLGFRASNRNITTRKSHELKLLKAYSEIKSLKEQLEAEQIYLREEIKTEHDFGNIIGESQVMNYVLYSMERIAPTDTTVLILGESGTGKELIARAIHNNSKRSQRPLIKVDCATLPANLIESELFGHDKGAFTGAVDKRIGRFELADGATLFLDEIGELPLELQKKLLRVLQDGGYERLGSATVRQADVRIIAATNRDLETDVRRGRFREDLWFRLNVLQLSLPPLRDRTGDIPLLVDWIVNKVQRRLGRQIRRIPDAVMETLMNYHWPGNVRELENVIERAIVFSHGNTLQLAAPLVKATAAPPSAPSAAPLKPLAEVEKDHILRALESTLWKISGKGGAADLLGINASTLRGRMLKHNIRRPAAHS